MSLHGRVVAVADEVVGDVLAVAAIATDTVLELDDVWAFDPAGGQVTIHDDTNTETVTYLSIDYDTNEITLEAGLANGYADETPVDVHPAATVTFAHVQIDGEDDEPVKARVPFSMISQLPAGMRDEEASESESVVIGVLRDEMVVEDVLGSSPGINAAYIEPTSIVAVGIRLYKATPQTIGTGDTDAIVWTSPSYDPQSMWAFTPDPTRITVPYDGHYRVSCNLSIDQDSNQHSKSTAAIRTNASAVNETRHEHIGHDNAGGYTYDVSDTLDLEAGDYIEVYFSAIDENHQLQEGPAATTITVDYEGQ